MLIDKDEGEHKVPSIYARKQTPELPAWIMYDKNVSGMIKYYLVFSQKNVCPNVARSK